MSVRRNESGKRVCCARRFGVVSLPKRLEAAQFCISRPRIHNCPSISAPVRQHKGIQLRLLHRTLFNLLHVLSLGPICIGHFSHCQRTNMWELPIQYSTSCTDRACTINCPHLEDSHEALEHRLWEVCIETQMTRQLGDFTGLQPRYRVVRSCKFDS